MCVTDYWHCRGSRSSPERLQDGVNATLYIDRRSILLADYRSHFSYLLPHHFHLLRVYIEPLELHSQSSRSCISKLCKAHTFSPPGSSITFKLPLKVLQIMRVLLSSTAIVMRVVDASRFPFFKVTFDSCRQLRATTNKYRWNFEDCAKMLRRRVSIWASTSVKSNY